MTLPPRLAALFATVALCLAGCEKSDLWNPSEDEVARTVAQPIDGYAEVYPDAWINPTFRVRIDAGRVIVVDGPSVKPGTVLIKDLRRVDDTRYEGTRLVGWGRGTRTTLRLISPTELVEHVEPPDWDILLVRDFRWRIVALQDEGAFAAAHGGLPEWPSAVEPKPRHIQEVVATVADIRAIWALLQMLFSVLGSF